MGLSSILRRVTGSAWRFSDRLPLRWPDVLLPRVMPCLLVSRGRLVKTTQFKMPRYVGDPVNAIKIYNEKEVDELVLLDIDSARSGQAPNYELIHRVADECFMPLSYGGGIRKAEQVGRLLELGVEKVILNSLLETGPAEVSKAANRYGRQCLVASLDVARSLFGKPVLRRTGGTVEVKTSIAEYVRRVEALGAGEILINDIEREGTWRGFDLVLVRAVSSVATVPVIATGGASSVADIGRAVKEGGASAVAIGSMAVFQGRELGVLVNFPSREQLALVLH